jgi:hypothetical protein
MPANTKRRNVITKGYGDSSLGSEFTTEQIRFMQAVDQFKRTHRRSPSSRELLWVAKALGYRQIAKPKHLPRYA